MKEARTQFSSFCFETALMTFLQTETADLPLLHFFAAFLGAERSDPLILVMPCLLPLIPFV